MIELGFRKTKFTQTIVNRANKTLFIVIWTSGFLDATQSQQKIAEDWDFAPTAVNWKLNYFLTPDMKKTDNEALMKCPDAKTQRTFYDAV